MIYKRYGNIDTIMQFQVMLGALFLCACLPVIPGAETVASILSASLEESSNHLNGCNFEEELPTPTVGKLSADSGPTCYRQINGRQINGIPLLFDLTLSAALMVLSIIISLEDILVFLLKLDCNAWV